MRVIAGEYRSRLLVAPSGTATRPTSDRLRETLFNVLGERVRGARFADLFAGSGAVGIEALSRGAVHCTFVEQGRDALAALRKNVASLGLTPQATIEPRSVTRALAEVTRRTSRLDIVFLDPPYQATSDYAATMAALADQHASLLAPEALVIAEHARRDHLQPHYGVLERTRELLQGDAALSFYSLARQARGQGPFAAADASGEGPL